jgi:MFS family permease
MLFLSPIVFLLSLYVGVIYGYLYLLFTTITLVFEQEYGFSEGVVGLSYLGIGVGSFVGLIMLGATSDKLIMYLSAKSGEKKPEYRLPPMIPGSLFVPASLFMYGWSAYYHTHWIVPIIGTSLLGVGMMISFVSASNYAYLYMYLSARLQLTTAVRCLDGRQHLSSRRIYSLRCFGYGC